MTIYRGDPCHIESFDLARTDAGALLGLGVYLTDDPVVAQDYTLLRSPDVLLNPEEDILSEEELLAAYAEHIIETELNGPEQRELVRLAHQNRFATEFRDYADRNSPEAEAHRKRIHADFEKAMTELQDELEAAAWKKIDSTRSQMGVTTNVFGSHVLVAAGRAGEVSSFELSRAYLGRCIHAEQPMSSDVVAAVRDFVGKALGDINRRFDLRDIDGQFCSFDGWIEEFRARGSRYAWTDMAVGGRGMNPSLDEFINGTHGGFSLFYNARERQMELIQALHGLGYVGFEYAGGHRISGTGARGGGAVGTPHRAFCLWDTDHLNRHRGPSLPLQDQPLSQDPVDRPNQGTGLAL